MFTLYKLLGQLLMPLPAALLVVVMAVLFIPGPAGRLLAVMAVSLIWMASTPRLGRWLLSLVMTASDPPPLNGIPRADAVVVLSGGFPWRELFAIQLHRRGKAPMLVCSGRLSARSAAILKEMVELIGIPPRQLLLESRSRNTTEGGQAFQRLAMAHGWRSVLLVSSAYHLARAVRRYQGGTVRVTAIPCPEPSLSGLADGTSTNSRPLDQRLTDWVPHPNGLLQTYLGIRELIARAIGW